MIPSNSRPADLSTFLLSLAFSAGSSVGSESIVRFSAVALCLIAFNLSLFSIAANLNASFLGATFVSCLAASIRAFLILPISALKLIPCDDARALTKLSSSAALAPENVGRPPVNSLLIPTAPPLLNPSASVAFLRITKLPTGNPTGPKLSVLPLPGTILTSPPPEYLLILFLSA